MSAPSELICSPSSFTYCNAKDVIFVNQLLSSAKELGEAVRLCGQFWVREDRYLVHELWSFKDRFNNFPNPSYTHNAPKAKFSLRGIHFNGHKFIGIPGEFKERKWDLTKGTKWDQLIKESRGMCDDNFDW